jgi:Leucine-rich repeat (LRR) protein
MDLGGLNGMSRGNATAIERASRQCSKGEKSLDLVALQLHDLSFLHAFNWTSLEAAHLNRNLINSISVLNKFHNLKVINATNCYIEEVSLKLPKLEELDLSNNFLKSFPTLINMQKLRHLSLNSNKLMDLQEMNVDATLGLTSLDLGNNPTLSFEARRDFNALVAKLKKLNLEYLDIEVGSVTRVGGMDELIKALPRLR